MKNFQKYYFFFNISYKIIWCHHKFCFYSKKCSTIKVSNSIVSKPRTHHSPIVRINNFRYICRYVPLCVCSGNMLLHTHTYIYRYILFYVFLARALLFLSHAICWFACYCFACYFQRLFGFHLCCCYCCFIRFTSLMCWWMSLSIICHSLVVIVYVIELSAATATATVNNNNNKGKGNNKNNRSSNNNNHNNNNNN